MPLFYFISPLATRLIGLAGLHLHAQRKWAHIGPYVANEFKTGFF